jgi:hypothetical protein
MLVVCAFSLRTSAICGKSGVGVKKRLMSIAPQRSANAMYCCGVSV